MDKSLRFASDEPSGNFEITVQVKDPDGNPTGKTRTYFTDSAYKMWQFYLNNKGKPKRKNNKTNVSNLPKEDEAKKILNEINVSNEKDGE